MTPAISSPDLVMDTPGHQGMLGSKRRLHETYLPGSVDNDGIWCSCQNAVIQLAAHFLELEDKDGVFSILTF